MDSLVADVGIISFYLLFEKIYICVYVYFILNTTLRWIHKDP